MSVSGANLPYNNMNQSPVFSTTGKDMNIIIGKEKQGQPSEFKSFLENSASSFLKETKEVEQKVTQFSEGKLDIEAVASEVATMSVKIEAAKRTAEELKTGIHSLLNMQM